MAIVNNFLLRTGGGNPSPIYSSGLARFDGLTRQPPTLARLTPRRRQLEHIAHTPARPLVDRGLPAMQQHQLPSFPAIHVFNFALASLATLIQTSERLFLPSVITEIGINRDGLAGTSRVQIALANNVVADLAEFALCTPIFQEAPSIASDLPPYAANRSGLAPMHFRLPVSVPLPQGTRNRVAVIVENTFPDNLVIQITITVQALQ